MQQLNLIKSTGFLPKENAEDVFIKTYTANYSIEIDTAKKIIFYGGKIKMQSGDRQNITKPEDWVVLECVNRLLEKGYAPENISLEKVYPSGHGTSGRLDICVTRKDKSEYLLIECKTYGKEFDKAYTKLKKDGGQLFTYFKFSNKADLIMLYASELQGNQVVSKNEIIKIEDEYRIGDVKDFYEKWNKLTKDNGVFDTWVNTYQFVSKALTPKLLAPIKQEDSGFIFNRFLEILRNNVVSDKGNAFNKIFTLFLCKVYDEKSTKENDELKFQWLEGKDDDISFQLRLTDLYKNGMLEFLEKQVTDFSEEAFENKFKHLKPEDKKDLLFEIHRLRLEKNNEFAIKEVFDHGSFKENAKVVKHVVELLQGYKIRYNKRQQYLSDFFELLLTTGLKQEAGQFFTPVPIAQFIIKSLPIDKLVNEKLEKGERNNLLPFIIDYAAGSGHFLTESMHEIQRHLDNKKPADYIADTAKKIKNWQEDHFDWATQYVYGIEKDYRLVKVGKVGCYLHGDGLANVILSDGLASFKHTKEYKGLLKKTDADFPKENKQFDVVLSNPPYSVPAFKLTAREYYTEEDFEIYNTLTDQSSQIEALFIERTQQLLKDGGMAGIILPSSILSNEGIYTKCREIILQYFDIVAITELGSNTFMATGTNTVVLFLRRRNNYVCINLKKSLQAFTTNLKDVTLNGIEKPISKYVSHVWQTISFDDYTTLLQKKPNGAIEEHEIYKEYKKKIKAKNEEQLWQSLLDTETEKLYYYILAYPQQVVLVKSGEKDAEKRFLGYEFSNRRGSEGIHPAQRGKHIEDCTHLFDPIVFDNSEKASTYIYKAFNGDFDFAIDTSLQKNINRYQLVDMLTFDRVDFEKSISLSVKKKVMIESKWEQVKLESVALMLKRGKSAKYGKSKIQVIKSGQARGYKEFDFSEKHFAEEFFVPDERQLKKGDILINSSGVGTAGRVTLFDLDGNFVTDSHITILRPDYSKVLPEFILLCLSSIGFKNIEAMALGQSGQIELTITTIENIRIPLPPKNIQEKILAEIEKLEKKERKTKGTVKELSAKIELIVNELWDSKIQKIRLRNLTELITKGSSPTWQNVSYIDSKEVLFITSENVREGYIDLSKRKYLENKFNEIQSRSILQKFDVLINIVGASIGRAAIFLLDEIANINQAVCLIRCNQKVLNPVFLNAFLNSNQAISIYDNMKIDVARANLSLQNISDLEIPLLPIAEQQKIVAAIEKAEEQINQLQKELEAIPKQKELILKKYL